jgi:F-type H+-transporting ATPase subunit delta
MNIELQSVANRYAEAVIELAVREQQEEMVLNEIKAINSVLGADRDTTVILNHPSIPKEQKKAFLNSLFGDKLSGLTGRLLNLLADRGRLDILPFVERAYHELLNSKKNISSASLVCSEALPEISVQNIRAQLTEHLGKKLELNVSVDPSLIGGVILKIGDQVIDGSLKGRLDALEKALLAV